MPESLSQESPLAIVGDEDVVTGFSALGFKVYAIKEQPEFKPVLEKVVRQKSAVCLVQENFYLAAQDEINNYKNLPFPVFIPFSKTLKVDLLENIVKDIRLKATGAF